MDHAERDQRILFHIAAFRVSLRAIVAELYFEGRAGACQNVLSRLIARGYLKSRQSFTGTRLAYYQLDGRGVRELGLPRTRADELNPQALNTHIAILWWSCKGNTLRFRVESSQIAEAIGCEPPTGEHCMHRGERGPRFTRVFVLGPDTDDQTALHRIKERLREADTAPGLGEWSRHGLYTFAILTDSPMRLRRIREAIRSNHFDAPGILRAYLAPGIASLPQFIDRSRTPQE